MANAKKKTSIVQHEDVETDNQKIQVVEDEVTENKKKNIIEKSEICEARYNDGLIYINFKGYGLITPNINNHKESQIEVFYEGEIGTADFKFRV